MINTHTYDREPTNSMRNNIRRITYYKTTSCDCDMRCGLLFMHRTVEGLWIFE